MSKPRIFLPAEPAHDATAAAKPKWRPQSAWEARIVALVAAKVHEADADFLSYRISLAELARAGGAKPDALTRKEIMRSIEHLGKATVRIQGDSPYSFMVYSLFAACGCDLGFLTARFDPGLKSYFLSLKENFTEQSLPAYLSLPSSYSQGLFEILTPWSAGGETLTLPLPDLHDMLGVPDSLRRDFKDFRRRVLERAHKDLHERTSLRFTWEAIKEGRGVAAVRFTFAPEPRKQPPGTEKPARRRIFLPDEPLLETADAALQEEHTKRDATADAVGAAGPTLPQTERKRVRRKDKVAAPAASQADQGSPLSAEAPVTEEKQGRKPRTVKPGKMPEEIEASVTAAAETTPEAPKPKTRKGKKNDKG